MCRQHAKWMACAMCIGLLVLAWSNSAAAQVNTSVDKSEVKEHSELEATLYAPFRAAAADRRTQGRSFRLSLAYPGSGEARRKIGRVILASSSPPGVVLQQWSGQAMVGASTLDIG